MIIRFLIVLTNLSRVLSTIALPKGFHILDPLDYAESLKDDLYWAIKNVPFVDVPQLPDIQLAFYYRWRSYRKHIKSTPEGFVVTEFLPDVGWAGKYNTIPAAAGHHLAEGRWIHNKSYLNNYTTFWFRRGGNPLSYTSWIAWATWQRYLVNGDVAFIVDIFPDLVRNLHHWVQSHEGNYDGRVCFWQDDGHDAMEVSISGNGCRPTIESVIFGETVALLEMAKLIGNVSVVEELTKLREQTRKTVLEDMWNPEIQSFAVIPLPAPPRPPPPMPPGWEKLNTGSFCCDQTVCKHGHSTFLFEGTLSQKNCIAKCSEFDDRCHFITVHADVYCMVAEYCNTTNPYAGDAGNTWTYKKSRSMSTALMSPGHSFCPGNGSSTWKQNETVSVRELLAFMPWYFSLATSTGGQLVPASNVKDYEIMWRQLFDEEGFAARWGLRSAELRSPCYNYSYMHRDCWNAPSWPYETARVLTGAANLLNDYPGQSAINVHEYFFLLDQYAKQHTQTYADQDTADPPGSGHIFEVLHPDLGYWINRDDGGSRQGDDYNHSTFIDLILTGLFGLRPRPDSKIVLNPLVPLGLLSHFAVDHVYYHGHYLSAVWDSDGTHYSVGKGLKLLVDGEVVASSENIAHLVADLSTAILI